MLVQRECVLFLLVCVTAPGPTLAKPCVTSHGNRSCVSLLLDWPLGGLLLFILLGQCPLALPPLPMVLHCLLLRFGCHSNMLAAPAIIFMHFDVLMYYIIDEYDFTPLNKRESKIWQRGMARNAFRTEEKSPFIYLHTQLLLKCDEMR